MVSLLLDMDPPSRMEPSFLERRSYCQSEDKKNCEDEVRVCRDGSLESSEVVVYLYMPFATFFWRDCHVMSSSRAVSKQHDFIFALSSLITAIFIVS